jgi:maleate isomerase
VQQLERAPFAHVDYGARARFGLILPSVNAICEPQLATTAPAGVTFHTTRLRLTGDDGLLGMLEHLEQATALVADLAPDRIVFHCTAVTTYAPEIVGEIRTRIAAVTAVPVVITSETIVAALRALAATRVVMVTPYPQATNDREVAFLAHHGIEVVRERGLGIGGGREMSAIAPQRWYEETLALRDARADAYFLSCTTIRSAEVIDALEAALDRPVITSNQAMLWGALREVGIDDRIAAFGRLLRAH